MLNTSISLSTYVAAYFSLTQAVQLLSQNWYVGSCVIAGKRVVQERIKAVALPPHNFGWSKYCQKFLVRTILPKNAKCGAKKLPFWENLETKLKF